MKNNPLAVIDMVFRNNPIDINRIVTGAAPKTVPLIGGKKYKKYYKTKSKRQYRLKTKKRR
jgi:hypothetical protein